MAESKTIVTVRVYTKPEARASRVGERHSYEGVEWRNSVDSVNSDGTGLVFLDCVDAELADWVCDQLDKDGDVDSYGVIDW